MAVDQHQNRFVLGCLLCDMVVENRFEWTPTHDRTLWPLIRGERRERMARTHGLEPDGDGGWRPIRNPTYIPAPTPLEQETDWVTWITEDDELEEEGVERDSP